MESIPLLVVASNFPPIQSAGVYRTLRLAKYLPERGWMPHVLTLRTDTVPKGTLIDDALLTQVPDEVSVYRAPARFPIERINRLLGRNGDGPSGKNFLSNGKSVSSSKSKDEPGRVRPLQKIKDRLTLPWMTPDRLVGWVSPATRLGIRTAKKSGTRVVYSSGPPWSNHLVAGGIVAATGVPWVADFRDPWVGNAFRPGRNDDTWAGRKHRSLEADVYKRADVVIFNTARAMEDAVVRAGDDLAAKSIVIPNGFDPALVETQHASASLNRTDFMPMILAHPGGFYGKRNVDSLLRALGKMNREGTLSGRDLQLDLIGADRPGRMREKELIATMGLGEMVNLTPPIAHDDCLARLAQANVLLLVQTEAPLCVPGKLYEYIAIGKPVLTITGKGSTADLVNAESLGPCVDPHDAPNLERTVRELLEQHRAGRLQNPDVSIRERYDGRNQMAQFDSAFRRALEQSSESVSAAEGLRE